MKKHAITLTVIVIALLVAITIFLRTEYLLLLRDKVALSKLTNLKFLRIRHHSPNLLVTMRPTTDEQLDSCFLEIKDYVLRTDTNGFIVTDKNHMTADLKFAFFGGSTTACLLVDEDKRMPELVTRKLEKICNARINVWNCGQVGTHSYHSLNFLTNCAWHLRPDYALFYGNVNDIAVLMHYGTYNNTNPDKALFFSLTEFDKRYKPKEGIVLSLLSLFQPKPEKDDDYADIRGQPLITDSEIIMTEITKVYKTIISTCKANNIQPVLITQVNNFDKLSYEWLLKNVPDIKPSREEYYAIIRLLNEYNKTLKKVAESENAILIDLEQISFPLDHFYSALHYNNKGAEAVSKIIAEQMSLVLMGDTSFHANKKVFN